VNLGNGLPAKLIDSILQRNCVLFLGPDVSESAKGFRGLPTSWQLADELAALCDYRGQYRPLPRMAQIYEYRFDKLRLVDYLRSRLNGGAYQPLPIHEVIARIPFRAIVYAGWDLLLERALERQAVAYDVVRSVTDLSYVREDRCVIYRPFGSLNVPSSLAVTQEEQFNVISQSNLMSAALHQLMIRHEMLLVGYAIDHNSLFVQLYQQVRQELARHRRAVFVVQSLHRPEDAAYWETLGVMSIVTEPTQFLYDLALKLAALEHRTITLPDLDAISQAEPVTEADLQEHTTIMAQVLDTLGIGELVEQSEIPLLSAQQARDLEEMRAAYERIAAGLRDVAQSAPMWLRQGNIEYARQNYAKAEQYYQRALATQPDLAEAYHNLHYVYLAQSSYYAASGQDQAAQQKLDDALQAYQKAIEIRPYLALLPDQYTIEAVLGQGGTGVVYRARDHATQQTVAVKLLKRAYVYNEKAALRFRREAVLLQRLQNEHIVRCIASQEYKGRHFMVMEYLGDQTLVRLLREEGPVSLDRAHQITQQVGQALQTAHQAGIIHRDIKPSNIFLVDGQARVIDFGLAADLTEGQPSVVGEATGTVRYMSPEQRQGAAVDERTDIYALATVFYELLTGRHPDEGAYQLVSELVRGVYPALDIVIERARQLKPQQRYADMRTFCAELARVVSLQPASQQAAWWRRVISRYQQLITLATSDHWYVLMALSLFLSYTLPLLLDPGRDREISRFAGILLWDVFLLSILTILYTTFLARRSGYATLAAYGPLIGSLLGLYTATLGWFTFTPAAGFTVIGDMSWQDTTSNIVIHGLFAVVVAAFSSLSIVSGVRMALYLRLGSRAGVLLGYAFVIVELVILAYILNRVSWG
jgi:tRNA A-37 threonylcarbamoyl transferase component Bud32